MAWWIRSYVAIDQSIVRELGTLALYNAVLASAMIVPIKRLLRGI